MSVIGEFIFALGFGKADTKPLDEAVTEGEKGAKKVESAWVDAAKGIGKGLAAIGAAAIGVGTALFGLADRSANALAAIDDLAKRSGHSARDIQRLSFAAQQSGASTEDLTSGLRKLQLSLVDAGKGTGPANDALVQLGLSAKDLAGLGAEDAFGTIADALQNIHDPALRTSLAVDLLGRGATALIPTLEGGSAALRKAGDEAERLGLVFSDDAVTAGAELNDSIDAMKATLGGLVTTIGVEAMPIIQEWLGELTEWIKQNRELIQTKVKEAVEAIITAIEKLAPIAAALVEGLINVVSLFDESESAVLQMVPALAALGVAVTLAAGPWGVLAAALLLVVANYDKILEKANEWEEFLSNAEGHRAALDAGTGASSTFTRRDNDFIGDEGGEARRRDEAMGKRIVDTVTEAAQVGLILGVSKASARNAQNLALSGRQRAATKRSGGGGRGRATEVDTTAFEGAHGDELRQLAGQHGVGEIGIDAALKAGAESLAEGASTDVARQAALSKLGSLAGRDFSSKGGGDPLLSQILGDENVPDVALSSIARGAEPQVLISNITNTFNFDNDFDIDGAREPASVANAVVQVIETTLQAAIEQSTKTAKVSTAR